MKGLIGITVCSFIPSLCFSCQFTNSPTDQHSDINIPKDFDDYFHVYPSLKSSHCKVYNFFFQQFTGNSTTESSPSTLQTHAVCTSACSRSTLPAAYLQLHPPLTKTISKSMLPTVPELFLMKTEDMLHKREKQKGKSPGGKIQMQVVHYRKVYSSQKSSETNLVFSFCCCFILLKKGKTVPNATAYVQVFSQSIPL